MSLTATRKMLAAALRDIGGLNVVDHEPDRPAPPQVIIALGNPCLEPGATYASKRLTYRLLCTVRPGAAGKVLADLEAVIETASEVLDVIDQVESWTCSEPVSLISGNDAIPCIEITTTLNT